MGQGDEDTIRIVPPTGTPSGRNLAGRARVMTEMATRMRPAVWIAAAALLAALLVGVGYLALAPSTPPAEPPATALAPAIPVRAAGVLAIFANRAKDLDVFRLDVNSRVLVLDFGSLKRQGAMLNRMAALTEKAGLPHDRLLTDAELDKAIRSSGDTPEDYYYGHDYSAADMRHFYVLADTGKAVLTPDEIWLRQLLQQEGFLAQGGVGGLISVPAEGAAADIDASIRRTILEHELSHGEFFTDPSFTAWTKKFWTSVMTEPERTAVRRFLVAQNYDPALDDLLANEAQAYLVFTRDPRMFTATMAGLSDDTVRSLRQRFRDGMPAGWLRQSLTDKSSKPRRRRQWPKLAARPPVSKGSKTRQDSVC